MLSEACTETTQAQCEPDLWAMSLDAQTRLKRQHPRGVESVCDVYFLFPKLGWSLEQQIFNQSKFLLLKSCPLVQLGGSLPKNTTY